MENKHSKAIPVDVVSELKDLISRACELLLPYVTPLTPEERHALPKTGEKTFGFVEKSFELANQNSKLCPTYFDMAGFRIDIEDMIALLALSNLARQLFEYIDDTAMVAGSEAYQAALIFYNCAKVAARQNVPGAKAVYEVLQPRFPGPKPKNSKTTPESDDKTV
ncbi:MAG: hypothetical protein LBL13_08720 [Bacteroidales bacterium]|jgi:hypothetical protein|nr:hypothetical protein [Bacteroidales bacterium]